jgi:hypothetical protein
MSHFIKLTTVVINKSHIIGITIKPKIYEILITNYNIDGFILFATGLIDVRNNVIKICETQNKEDYETITKWINNI